MGDQPGMRFPVMSGTVVAGSVDMSACTCSVLLSVDDADSPATEGVLLNGVSGNINGVLCFPADGSNVWVAEIDGPGKWGIIKTSDLVKMVVTISNVVVAITDSEAVIQQDNAVFTISSGKFSIKNDSQDFKTIMDTHFDNLAQMTFTNGAGTTAVANNVTALNTDKTNFDQLFY